MPHLFDPITLRSVTFRNRIGVSPMCQYSSTDGFATDWHLVHLGSRATGGAGLVMMEATAVEARGRITPGCNGIYYDKHMEMLSRITAFISSQGAVPAIQIAHAGRKASRALPWDGDADVLPGKGGWDIVGPSPIPFSDGYRAPHELTKAEIKTIAEQFGKAAARAKTSGFRLVEIHAAHGYLAHTFLSPLSNKRTDEYGGSFENRIRFLLETTREVRKQWPDNLPLAARLSCSDWAEDGWTIEDSVALSLRLKDEGVDFIDCSSGALVPYAKIPVGAGYQVPFAEAIKKAGIPTAAVGMITDPMQADELVRNGRSDFVFLAREFLRDPYFALHAAQKIHQGKLAPVPKQYGRAFS
jgi:2,4-dienoyl-CoA reductase-like NADH-dependent reductase (Old Yellow Enzyme family)